MPKCLGTKWTDACGELEANISQTTSTVAELCASEGDVQKAWAYLGTESTLCISRVIQQPCDEHRLCEGNSVSTYV